MNISQREPSVSTGCSFIEGIPSSQISGLKQLRIRRAILERFSNKKLEFGYPKAMRAQEKLEALSQRDVNIDDVHEIHRRLTCGHHLRAQKKFLDGNSIPSLGEWRLAKAPKELIDMGNPIMNFWDNLYPNVPSSIFAVENFIDHILHRGSWHGYRPDTFLTYDGYELVLCCDSGGPVLLKVDDLGGVPVEECELPVYPRGTTQTKVFVIDLDLGHTKSFEAKCRKLGVSIPDPIHTLLNRHQKVLHVLPGGIWLRSSWSGGLQGWFALPEPWDAELVYLRIEELLATVGLQLEDGWVEVFPNPRKGYIRLPLGLGSLLLDPKTLAPIAGDSIREQVPKFLGFLQNQQLPEALFRLPIQKRPKECRDWDWNEETAHAVLAGKREDHVFTVEPKPVLPRKPPIGGENKGVVPFDSAEEIPQLLLDGDKTWAGRHKICFRATSALKARGYLKLDDEAILTFRKWVTDPKNSTLSKSLSNPTQRESRLRDLQKTLAWCWENFKSESPSAAAEKLSSEDKAFVRRVVDDYLALFPKNRRNDPRRPLERALGMVVGMARRNAHGLVSIARKAWCYSKDSKQRLKSNPGGGEDPLYYVRFRNWLVSRGYLQLEKQGTLGQGTSYIVKLPPLL